MVARALSMISSSPVHAEPRATDLSMLLISLSLHFDSASASTWCSAVSVSTVRASFAMLRAYCLRTASENASICLLPMVDGGAEAYKWFQFLLWG